MKRVNYLDRLLNLALRGMMLAAKFLLILFLARFLEPSELGLYGLLVAAIGYALYKLEDIIHCKRLSAALNTPIPLGGDCLDVGCRAAKRMPKLRGSG